ncbi:Hypothetical_protein [Hexamita inflata]|uniref:Hypothetical_protein n=1 Tax=Hexamita inflata TaxID=28002 RepID=A0AA86NKZ1_9EUKA|nr:Hypothetical protein HINF_LOCUS8558 [Hexamita inflata]
MQIQVQQQVLKMQRRIQQLELDLQTSETSRNDLIELLKKRQTSNTLFTDGNQTSRQVTVLNASVQDLKEKLEISQRQHEQTLNVNKQLASQLNAYQVQLKQMVENSKKLVENNQQLKRALEEANQKFFKALNDYNEEKLLTNQLVDMQNDIVVENEQQKNLNTQLSMENMRFRSDNERLINEVTELKQTLNPQTTKNQQNNILSPKDSKTEQLALDDLKQLRNQPFNPSNQGQQNDILNGQQNPNLRPQQKIFTLEQPKAVHSPKSFDQPTRQPNDSPKSSPLTQNQINQQNSNEQQTKYTEKQISKNKTSPNPNSAQNTQSKLISQIHTVLNKDTTQSDKSIQQLLSKFEKLQKSQTESMRISIAPDVNLSQRERETIEEELKLMDELANEMKMLVM